MEPANEVPFLSRRLNTDCTIRWNRVGSMAASFFCRLHKKTVVKWSLRLISTPHECTLAVVARDVVAT